MENPKRYSEKIKRKEGGNNSGLQIPAGSYNMMAELSIIKPHFEPAFRSFLDPPIRPKLEISDPMDESEMQADEFAESFVSGDADQSQEIVSQQVPEISRSGEGSGMQTSDAFDQQLQNSKGQGQKLDEGTKSELEQHTGADLSGVNIHTGKQAHEMSESINAKAFAHGQDIYFKEGNYNPQSEEGKSLLAHEVAHTVQSERTPSEQGGGVSMKIQREPDINKDLESVWFKGIKELEDAFDGNLLIEEGATGSYVKRIQQALMFLIIDIGPGRDDGIFGEDTKAGVITLQEIWGTNIEMKSIDGIVGKETMGELDRIFKKIKLPEVFQTEEEKGGKSNIDNEEKSTAAQILETLENDIGTRINNFGRIGAKPGNYDEIKNGQGKKIFDEPGGKITFRLKYNATVTVFGEHKDPVNKGWIYVYSPELDKAGWVQRPYVEYAPTPNAELYFVQKGDMLKDVVRQHYTNIPDEINDARLLVNAVAMVNSGMEGLVYNIPQGEEKTNWLSRNLLSDEGVQAQAVWNSVIIKEGHNIWLPGVTEIQAFKAAGILVPGSVTQEYWEGFVDVLKFAGGVVIGFFEGLWAAFTDLLGGVWEILKAIWFELTSSLTEKIASYLKTAIALKTWWDKLDVKHELKLLWDKFMYHSTPYEQGEFWGKIIGYIVFQIILIESGALIAAVIRWMARMLSEAGELVAAVFRAAEVLPEAKVLEEPKLSPGDKLPIKDAVEEGKSKPEIKSEPDKPKTKTKGVEEDQLSDKAKNYPSPLTESELARVYKWQDIRNKYLKKWREMDLSAYSKEVQELLTKKPNPDNAIRNNMTPDDLAAVIKEERGVKIYDEAGNYYNHIQEYENAITTVTKRIQEIQKALGELTDLNSPDALILQEKLGDLSNIKQSYLDAIK